jgi:hypothetical protein
VPCMIDQSLSAFLPSWNCHLPSCVTIRMLNTVFLYLNSKSLLTPVRVEEEARNPMSKCLEEGSYQDFRFRSTAVAERDCQAGGATAASPAGGSTGGGRGR